LAVLPESQKAINAEQQNKKYREVDVLEDDLWRQRLAHMSDRSC